jgi:hypothetical protein
LRVAVAATPQTVAMNGDAPFFTARAAESDHRGGTLKIVRDLGDAAAGIGRKCASIIDSMTAGLKSPTAITAIRSGRYQSA